MKHLDDKFLVQKSSSFCMNNARCFYDRLFFSTVVSPGGGFTARAL